MSDLAAGAALAPKQPPGVLAIIVSGDLDVIACGTCFAHCPAAGFPLKNYQRDQAQMDAVSRLLDKICHNHVVRSLNHYEREKLFREMSIKFRYVIKFVFIGHGEQEQN